MIRATPVPGLTLVPFTEEAQRLQRVYRGCVLNVNLGFDAVYLHSFKTVIDRSRKRFLHISVATRKRGQFIADDAASPTSIPSEETARTEEKTICKPLDGPADARVIVPPVCEYLNQFFGLPDIGHWVSTEPAHAFGIAMDSKHRWRVAGQKLPQ